MTNKIEITTRCPECGKNIILEMNKDDVLPSTSRDSQYPEVRGNIDPIGSILVYRISSEQIKDFIFKKARHYVPEVRMTVVPRYCEKKRKNQNDPHHSYASLKIAFSEHIIEKKEDFGWYGQIGENNSNVKLHEGIMTGLIKRYQYNRKEIEHWMKNYKILEDLENNLGMDEKYVNDLYQYSVPQRVKTDSNESWIFFTAAPENVIADMLTEKYSNKIPGRVQIQDVYQISKDIVEFVVYIHPVQMKMGDNPHVRQILLGEEKPKK